MAKFKLKIAPMPDFKLPVKFKLPNGEEATIVFTVKHKNQPKFKSFTSAKPCATQSLLLKSLRAGIWKKNLTKKTPPLSLNIIRLRLWL